MKRIISSLVIFFLIISASPIFCYGQAIESVLSQDEKIYSKYLKLPYEDAIDAIESGVIDSQSAKSGNAVISDIVFSDIGISIDIQVDGIHSILSGNLYVASTFAEILVGELKDESSNFTVLSFRVKNNTDYYKYMFSDTLKNQKSLMIYLLDENKNVLFIECQLDDYTTQTKYKYSLYDGTELDWILNITKGKRGTEIYNSAMFPDSKLDTTKSSHYYIWGPTDVIVYTFYIFGDTWQMRGYPSFDGYVNDIPANFHEHWTSKLILAQSLYINGVHQGSGHSTHYFQICGSSDYGNDIDMTLATGYNTRLQARNLGYNLLKGSTTNWTGAISDAFGVISSANPTLNAAYSLITNVVSFINNISFSSTSTLYNNSLYTFSDNVRADSHKIVDDTLVYICCSGNYANYSYDVYPMNSTYYNTSVGINWRFDMKFNGSLDSEYSATEEVSYIVNN